MLIDSPKDKDAPRVAGKFSHWPDFLQHVVSAYNSSPIPSMSTVRISPFEMLYGRKFRWAADSQYLEDPDAVALPRSIEEYWLDRKRIQDEIKAYVRKHHEEIAATSQLTYDLSHKVLDLKGGELVLLHTPTRAGKLASQFTGPFRVEKAIDNTFLVYRLRDCKSNKLVRAHVQRIRVLHGVSESDLQLSPSLPMTPDQPKRIDAEAAMDDIYPRDTQEEGKALPAADSIAVIQNCDDHQIHVGKVVSIDPETQEFEFHYWIWQPTKKGQLDQKTKYEQREYLPEWRYKDKRGRIRSARGWTAPHGQGSALIHILGMDECRFIAHSFELTQTNKLPQKVIQEIRKYTNPTRTKSNQ